jgi:hypothetical protein
MRSLGEGIKMGNKDKDRGSAEPGWDWITFVMALVIAVILAMLTFELWAPHGFPH